MKLYIKKLCDSAIIPTRATDCSAGLDLCACADTDIVIKPHEIVKIHTGIAVMPDTSDVVLLIFARSGIASKYAIAPVNAVGVIDSDYRGEIIIPLINHGSEPFAITNGMRIAQLVALPCFFPQICETEVLTDTVRGNGGFGSTGL